MGIIVDLFEFIVDWFIKNEYEFLWMIIVFNKFVND